MGADQGSSFQEAQDQNARVPGNWQPLTRDYLVLLSSGWLFFISPAFFPEFIG
jgi:hypothetical protein